MTNREFAELMLTSTEGKFFPLFIVMYVPIVNFLDTPFNAYLHMIILTL